MSSTVPPVPTNKSAKSKKAKNDRKRHNGLESSPLMVLDRPADIAAAISEDRISIEDMTYIGSYSWVDSTEPTIVVPGSPAVWHDRRTPYTVPPDRVTFMYEDAYRMPQYPNLARMRAIDIMTAEKGIQVDWPSVDFITDRNALRKLLKWAGDTSGKDFRIDLELAGERTVFLNRWEAKTRNRLGPQEQSYGFAFEKASTHPAPDCQGTTGHHRISSYGFGGLRMIVSYEVDACIAAETTSTGPHANAGNARRRAPKSAPASSPRPPVSPPNNAGPSTSAGSHKGLKTLQIVRGGKEVSQRSLIELKSSSTISWMDVYPQLYFGQIPYLYQGLHLRGRFTRITKRALSEEDITRRDSALEAKFCKVRNALRTIQALVIQHGHQTRLSLVYESNQGRRLEVYKRVSKASCLPQEILQRFEIKWAKPV
ncbi:hypothetical protein FOMPIDRAFT_91296 [Fomitopsis schrenkii]|uniref:Geranylgeranyl pyrophosphate synthetase n=1 Tax=Fomitopsis schrenkii TaxID=2126942 RepID=S8DQ73_FOMSC|nr:hypothetical protein FOMPIDRAFT_91296 [Fomitopsis schrenkii]